MVGTLIVLIFGGMIGAAEIGLTFNFFGPLLGPHLVPDKYQGLVILAAALIGANGGVAVTPRVACLRQTTPGLRLTSCFIASILGIPAAFMGAMFLFAGPIEMIVGFYIVQLLLLLAFVGWVHRETKAERARDDKAALSME